ncbi:MAG: DNA alkylation repair protein [Gammaproteobacteria bacterium]|nr:DNA alkylation repair protein [Gammaproteobacteria bacterium]
MTIASQPIATAKDVREALRGKADPATAQHAQRFFKTAPGEYGEGDMFLGIRVPEIRKLLRRFRTIKLPALRPLLRSKYHEERLFAVLMLAGWCSKSLPDDRRQAIYDFYLANKQWVNNWDLVDGSAPYVVGRYLRQRDRAILYQLIASAVLWDRRIAVLATYDFIKEGDFADTLKLARRCLTDEHDLMHKAAGWMLREIGKRDQAAVEPFLVEHCRTMPRTLLRYSIEHLDKGRRAAFLRGQP